MPWEGVSARRLTAPQPIDVYDGWDMIQETTGGVTTNFTRTLNIDEPLAFERTDGTIRHYVQDALGSVVALTDAEGLVTTTYEYDAFGNVTINGTDDQPFQYTGRENDGTGLYYYRARYYSPEIRRFISEDPIRLAGGINYYRYVDDNPLSYRDPYGKCGWPCYAAIGALVGLAAEFIALLNWEDAALHPEGTPPDRKPRPYKPGPVNGPGNPWGYPGPYLDIPPKTPCQSEIPEPPVIRNPGPPVIRRPDKPITEPREFPEMPGPAERWEWGQRGRR